MRVSDSPILPSPKSVGRKSEPMLSRKTFLKSAVATGAALLAGPATALAQTADTNRTSNMPASDWDKTFPKSDAVDHRKITFRNRYGISLTGDLYSPRGASGRLPALVISGPFGAVKEQSSGLYAQTMAGRGFVTLAFDPSFTGESGGEPRNVASPDINTEDFSAAVDAIGLLPNVDREKIGVIGICGWGGSELDMEVEILPMVVETMAARRPILFGTYDYVENALKTPRTKDDPVWDQVKALRSACFDPRGEAREDRLKEQVVDRNTWRGPW